MTFQLDPRLKKDCYQLAESEHSFWLLLNNSHFPWLIIVPKVQESELYLLTQQQQAQIQFETNLLSEFIDKNFDCSKLNVASIGNIVKQMHIHIIGRSESDPCWPGVVWGTDFKPAYETAAALEIQTKLQLFCQHKSIKGIGFASLQ